MLELALVCPLICSGIKGIAPSHGPCSVVRPVLVVQLHDLRFPVCESGGTSVLEVLEVTAVECERESYNFAGIREMRRWHLGQRYYIVVVHGEGREIEWEDNGRRESGQGSHSEERSSDLHS